MKTLLILVGLFLQIVSAVAQENMKNHPDSLIIYELPMFKNYFVGVCCQDIYKHYDVSVVKYSNRKKVWEAFAKFDNLSNLERDTSFRKIDARVIILFKKKDEIIIEVCATRTGMIQIDNKIYRMNKELRDFFIANKLMINFSK